MQYKICSVEKFSVKKLGKKLSCIVMDYIPHKDLSDIIKKKLSIKEIVKYAIGICEALSLIHNEGMTHRDIKPSNIKIDSLANAYIFDLEIAKIKDKISITSRDVVVGTLQYMSPEQTYSNPSLNYRSDIYSLGITLFEMIEGQVPFDSTASDYDEYKKEIMRKHREEEPPPIIRSDCPESLKEVVFTALKKDREERYSSAQEMADALTAVLESLNN
jgi:serine/threonine-protein kinase